MLVSSIDENEKLVVQSKYDSGVHLGFTAGVQKDGEYTLTTLDKELTAQQISYLEMMLMMEIKKMLDPR
ncbi:hypothetical protein ASswx1_48 [Aeromonas phage Asswx_1]|uniref:Uncharacterized protein n=1 Tax=Aeromonas phage Asswx_1 TaxID=2419739 RepID=A0A411B7U8_9CAUD|nr:hypothetical protein ASswx1_48 [Aeromonas phage Asswx_1]